MKDARYSRIKIVLLVAVAALALLYFNLIKPVFEDRIAAARAAGISAARDAEDIEAIKNDPRELDKKTKAAEAEIAAQERRLGLSPDAARKYVLEKAVEAGVRSGGVSITEGDENPLPLVPSVSERKYTVTVRGGYDEGAAFMRKMEESETAWSVDGLTYDGDGETWRVELSLLSKEASP
jgi:hypothetical protein